MSWIDWLIVLIPLAGIIWTAFYSGRFARSAVDFLAAGRVCGRYVISVGDLASGLSVITLVAGSEQNYQTGFGISFWSNIIAPIGIVLALTGYCTYRWRETRSLSKGQFIELRYGSKTFRIVTAAVSTISEMVTNAIGPAIAANFFIYYLGLPHKIMIFGIGLPCYAIVVTMCLTLAMLLIWPAGRISLLITDSVQMLLAYPIFVMIVGFILLKFSWNVDISPILWDRTEHQSFMNPYDVSQLRDFNMFALLVTVTSTIMNRASWIGNDTSNAGRTPHEQKMAGILGSWRNGFAFIMILLVAIVVIVFMNSGNFAKHDEKNNFKVTNNELRQQLSDRVLSGVVADKATYEKVIDKVRALPEDQHVIGTSPKLSQKQNLDTRYFDTVREALGDSPEGRYAFQQYRTLYQQMMMPVVLSNILPVGLTGVFCLLMVMLLISTDDARIFNATGCIVQDMILPFYKRRLTSKEHLRLLRFTSLGVAIFFLIVALFFSQLDYINMFVTIMCALWLGGAGPIMIFGLYTRFGNLTGAWCAIIFGSGTSLLGLIFQRQWALHIYPFLESTGWVTPLNTFLITVSSPLEPWVHWEMDPVKFPINSFEIFFISMMLSIGSYIIGSYLTYKPYDLDKLLHRGKYSDGPALVKEPWTLKNVFSKLIGINSEYTTGDKAIAWALFGYTIVYQLLGTFVAVVIWNYFSPWPNSWWNNYFFIVSLIVPGCIGLISTVWFMTGGIIDTRRLFIDLAARQVDPNDNGQVEDDITE